MNYRSIQWERLKYYAFVLAVEMLLIYPFYPCMLADTSGVQFMVVVNRTRRVRVIQPTNCLSATHSVIIYMFTCIEIYYANTLAGEVTMAIHNNHRHFF